MLHRNALRYGALTQGIDYSILADSADQIIDDIKP